MKEAQKAKPESFVGTYAQMKFMTGLEPDECLHRAEEQQRVLEILAKDKNANVMIVGEPGVGKTQVVKGVVQRVKDSLGLEIVKVNPHFMFHTIQSKAQFDDKVINILNAFSQTSNNVLFIDDFDIFFKEYKGNDLEFDMLISTYLEQNALKSIFVVSAAEYNTYANSYIGKFFEPVFINELTEEQLFDIVKTKQDSFHGIEISDHIIKSTVKLSERFITRERNPKSALELLNSTVAHIRINESPVEHSVSSKLSDLAQRINDLKEAKNKAVADRLFVEAAVLKEQQNLVETEYNNELTTNKVTVSGKMSEEHLRNVISSITKIPINKLNTDKLEKIKKIEQSISKYVVNQDDAIAKLSKAVKRNTIGIRDQNKPVGVFLFVGPTGTGKTYLTKILAETYYTSKKDIVRLDMSEYSDKIAVNKLFGSAPGYVGYEEGGILTRAVMDKPHSIILLDEIEKAHPSIFNTLLQVFDEGHMTDNKGRKVSFKNTIIIMTSNIGCHTAVKKTEIRRVGFGVTETAVADKKSNFDSAIQSAIKEVFPPEFINRIDDTILFNSLSHENLTKIIRLELDEIAKRLAGIGMNVAFEDEIESKIMQHNRNNIRIEYGAREIKRLLIEFEDFVTEYIFENPKGDIHVSYDKGYIVKKND